MAGVIDYLRARIGRLFSNGSSFSVAANQPYFVGTTAVYPDSNSETYLTAYNTNATVFSVVELIGKRFAQLPRYEYKVVDTKQYKKYKQLYNSSFTNKSALSIASNVAKKAFDDEVVDGALSKLILKPNGYQGQDEFFKMLITQYELFGEAFVWKNRGVLADGLEGEARHNKPVLELHVLPSNMVEVLPDPADVWGILGYELQISGTNLFIPKEDIIHWKQTNPNFDAVTRTHLRGQSSLRALLRTITQANSIEDAATAMFQNGGAKGILFDKLLRRIEPVQEKQIRDVIDRKINSGSLKSAVAAIQGDWGYIDLGLSSVDMELLKADGHLIEKICNAMGVPPEMFIAGNTYQNKKEARQDFLTNKIIPLCASCDDELNRGLAKDFKTGTVIHTDYENEPELQEDIKEVIEYSTKLFDRGIISGNEFRVLANYEETTEPMHDKYLVSGNYTPIEDLDLANQEQNYDAIGNQVVGTGQE